MKIQDIVKKLNQLLLTGFAKTYQSHDPALGSLAYTVESKSKAGIKYLFYQFISGLKVFTGNRVYDSFPDTYSFAVVNKTFDKGLEIQVDDLEEGIEIGVDGQLIGADPYSMTINSLMMMALDHPFELMMTLIENGTSSTPLTSEGITNSIVALDGQPLFDTDHDYAATSGSQANILTGTGNTAAQLKADVLAIIAKFSGFYYTQNGTANAKKRKLNKTVTKINIHCPVELVGVFIDLKNSKAIAATGDNTVAGYINEVIGHQFTDTNDWYCELVDSETPFMRPLLNQRRTAPKLDLPKPDDESVKQNDAYQYGVRYKGMIGIGAWWKMIKVTNT